ncbi:transglutaminase-like cysteine peptidase [Rhizobium halophytocola]|uniref:Transglutaminase-like cysteine proteinase n=1 Tax=Rhizobium halophytocola TaxID=735519 RepID=A0ABS4DSR5_9HYPH|nr:transglutaminase-like cysteine peptidase [Rhizobium halophytocola]MBP1848732.1 putative transglutaminase-like cysteine proteinase [Rhizobium halophytocola]
MWKKMLIAAVSAVAGLAFAFSAEAAGPGGLARNLASAPGVSFIRVDRPTLAPFAYVKFCMTYPGECNSRGGTSLVHLNRAKRGQLFAVNRRINQQIRPVHDAAGLGGDVWQVNVTSGDCEEFALAKRQRLIALGWPSSALRIAVARTYSGEGHAVLVVKTSAGDLVLDNRTTLVKPWQTVALHWEKIQSSDNPRLWYTM